MDIDTVNCLCLGRFIVKNEHERKTQFLFIYLFIVFLLFLWAAPAAYGGSQARGPIGAVATGLRQSYSNARSLTH